MRRAALLVIIVGSILVGRADAIAQRTSNLPGPPVATPPDVKAGSINCEECPYPYPTTYLPITLYGQDLRMAFMDVAPSGQPNGHTVINVYHLS